MQIEVKNIQRQGIRVSTEIHVTHMWSTTDKDRISGVFGGAILCELEQADALVFQHKGQRLLGDLDTSFDRSRAVQDLRTPPTDDKDLGHKINLLATIMDKFKIRKLTLRLLRTPAATQPKSSIMLKNLG